MPVAVLSSLSLGLAVDYAIHFLARSRQAVQTHGNWRTAVTAMFGEPARAISRNVIVVGVGFLPLLAAPLMPYKTVGMLIAMILITAGAATLLILPALIRILEPWLFPRTDTRAMLCRRGTCAVTATVAAAVVAVNVQSFFDVSTLVWIALTVIAAGLGAAGCWLLSRRESCANFAQPVPQGVEV
jgi:uncharacterized protein